MGQFETRLERLERARPAPVIRCVTSEDEIGPDDGRAVLYVITGVPQPEGRQ